jgi:catechol 2,3-dioxygenase-like lactoylglutathione lyase family enzyme
MTRLDHLTIRVRDLDAARAWYVGHLGMKLEFEVPGRRTVALQDDARPRPCHRTMFELLERQESMGIELRIDGDTGIGQVTGTSP